MRLEEITPLILTYNEERNIGRVLDRLTWARRILIVDSYSTDATLDIAESYSDVDIVQHEFDSFANQCNFGLSRIETPWVLSLDADYVCSEALIDEIGALPETPCPNGFSVEFIYCIFGEPLRGTLYPPRTVLYRKETATYHQEGHGHRVHVDGRVGSLDAPIYHDDRKSLSRWFDNQHRYAQLEAEKLHGVKDVNLADRLRQTRVLGVLLIPLYCLFWKGLIMDGRAGWYYVLQRAYAELLLVLHLLDQDLRSSS